MPALVNVEKHYANSYCVRVANTHYVKGYYSSLERAKEILNLEQVNRPQHSYGITSGYLGTLRTCNQWDGTWLIAQSLEGNKQ